MTTLISYAAILIAALALACLPEHGLALAALLILLAAVYECAAHLLFRSLEAKLPSFVRYVADTPIRSISPEYRIPPDRGDQALFVFGCPPLLDCCLPFILRELDRKTWDTLLRTHAVDIELQWVAFHRLVPAVQSGEYRCRHRKHHSS